MAISATPKTLIAASVALLALAAVFGVLNTYKAKSLRSTAADAQAASESADRQRASEQRQIKAREAAIAAEKAKISESEKQIADSEAEMVKTQKEKDELQAKLQQNETEIANLQKQIDEAKPGPANPGAPSTQELQAQLDDSRRQLDDAEREKNFLSDKLQSLEVHSSHLEEEKKQRVVSSRKVGLRGTILAVNHAYNFVVLNLGGREGVEANSEMLVLRDGSFIGKIRISSVEPATAIGDIMTSTLARGVQVQPGDTVIYAGTNS